MDDIQATTYDTPARLAHGRKLNTIMEENEAMNLAMRSDDESSGTEGSDNTVVGKPLPNSRGFHVAAARRRIHPPSPLSDFPTPASSAGTGYERRSMRSSTAESDDGTVFSESCPSLADSGTSEATTFYNHSARSSLASPNKPKFPGLVIPRDSWHSVGSGLKEYLSFEMSPASKIPLSPEALSSIPAWPAAANATPSLGAATSITSESPSVPAVSAPQTPDMQSVQVEHGEHWAADRSSRRSTIAQQFAHDTIPIGLGPSINTAAQSEAWTDIVTRFPLIPGATPVEQSPITPDVRKPVDYLEPKSAAALRLPDEALRTLHNLVREPSLAGTSDHRGKYVEMEEGFSPPSRPRSDYGATPLSEYSEYSFTQLSIPSPGGFFASLGAGSRHTWSFPASRSVLAPDSAIAERFYDTSWTRPEDVAEQVIEVEDTTETEGPPTVTQADFGAEVKARTSLHSDPSSETSDLYGPSTERHGESREIRYEYEEAYEDELKHSAEVNIDRTSTWLAQQTTYFSAMRETNPVNDLTEPSVVQHPARLHSKPEPAPKVNLRRNKSVRFDTPDRNSHGNATPTSPKDPIFKEALTYHITSRRPRDVFVAASPRNNYVQSVCQTEPTSYLDQLNGKVELRQPKRQKYSGPFSQNPRQTCLLKDGPSIASSAFEAAEKQQHALDAILPHSWTVDALSYLYGGRLLASAQACEKLSKNSSTPLSSPECIGKKRLRVLDLGGTPTSASWAWQVALKWPNVKVYSVITKQQASAAAPNISSLGEKPARKQAPPNHRTVTVPHLWSLPFAANHFDVVSARSLHSLLKSEPVPGQPQINEFDMTLKEIMRVLKVGGTLDFLLMDSGIKGAGPLGEKTSVEFGFGLRSMGYERDATRTWVQRLSKAGFRNTKRAYVALPVGRRPQVSAEEGLVDPATGMSGESLRDGGKTWKDAPRPLSEVSVRRILDEYTNVEAVQGPVGSTGDVADITGLLGSYMWQSWVVRTRQEQAQRKANVNAAADSAMSETDNATNAKEPQTVDRAKLLDGLAEVVEEGRRTGACWRVLSGYTIKPKSSKKPRKTVESVQQQKQHDQCPNDNQTPSSSSNRLSYLHRRNALRSRSTIGPGDLEGHPPSSTTITITGTDLSLNVDPDLMAKFRAQAAEIQTPVSPESGVGTMGTIQVRMDF